MNIRAIAKSPTVLAIQWDPPVKMNGRIEEYKLYYMEIGTSEEHEITTPLTSYVFENLRKYAEYSLWVVAINKNGPGSSSEEIEARTLSDKPDETPQNCTVEASSSTVRLTIFFQLSFGPFHDTLCDLTLIPTVYMNGINGQEYFQLTLPILFLTHKITFDKDCLLEIGYCQNDLSSPVSRMLYVYILCLFMYTLHFNTLTFIVLKFNI